jgi:general secretion pathway protein C
MQAIPLERPSLAQTAAVSLATTAALALLGLVLAYWTWAWLAPRPEPRAPEAAQAPGRVRAAYALFGSAQRDRAGAAPAGIAIRLVGVVAATRGRSGYALLQLDPKENVAVREGGEVAPGIRLAEVGADHVTLERAGIRETLAWPEKGAR